jgi:hypothetical protein
MLEVLYSHVNELFLYGTVELDHFRGKINALRIFHRRNSMVSCLFSWFIDNVNKMRLWVTGMREANMQGLRSD